MRQVRRPYSRDHRGGSAGDAAAQVAGGQELPNPDNDALDRRHRQSRPRRSCRSPLPPPLQAVNASHQVDEVELQGRTSSSWRPARRRSWPNARPCPRRAVLHRRRNDLTDHYVSENVENVLLRLIQATDFDVAARQRGDHLHERDRQDRPPDRRPLDHARRARARMSNRRSSRSWKDHCQDVRPAAKCSDQDLHPDRHHNILFICGGVQRLERIIESASGARRSASGPTPLPQGFTTVARAPHAQPAKVGLISEFIGVLPWRHTLRPRRRRSRPRADRAEERDHPRVPEVPLARRSSCSSSPTGRSRRPPRQPWLADQAPARSARSWRSHLLEVMYDIPERAEIRKCIITEEQSSSARHSCF